LILLWAEPKNHFTLDDTALALGIADQLAIALSKARLSAEVLRLRQELEHVQSSHINSGLVGKSDGIMRCMEMAMYVADSYTTVLIQGESGTGKEVLADLIQSHSSRAGKAYVKINCGAIPDTLLESELFGHEKGAFTGASVQRIGKFEQCHKGTIFLDEIGDMPLGPQTKILRVLQSGTFERVGGNLPIKVDVRIIAATNKPLEDAVANRTFREDLFYRLNVVKIDLPALRTRREDIPLLVNYFLSKYGQKHKQRPKSISPDVLAVFEQYHWPGNVRELENIIQRALVVSKGQVILPSDLPSELTQARTKGVAVPSEIASALAVPLAAAKAEDLPGIAQTLFEWARKDSKLKIIPAVERELIVEALKHTKGNQVQAAKLLGITRATLRKRVDKFGIKQELEIK